MFIGGIRMKKFKYVVGGLCIRSTPEEQQKTLDKMGKDGMELVSVVAANGYFMFYFKKEIKEAQKTGEK